MKYLQQINYTVMSFMMKVDPLLHYLMLTRHILLPRLAMTHTHIMIGNMGLFGERRKDTQDLHGIIAVMIVDREAIHVTLITHMTKVMEGEVGVVIEIDP